MSFPMSLLVVMHFNMNINVDSNKHVYKQTKTNKQTNMYMYGHLKRGLKPFNLTERSPH